MNFSSPKASVFSQHSQNFYCPFFKEGKSRSENRNGLSIYCVKAVDSIWYTFPLIFVDLV